jgi:hypothetical protein
MVNPTFRVCGDYGALAAVAAVAMDSEAVSAEARLTDSRAREPLPSGAAYFLEMLLAFRYRQLRKAAEVNAARALVREFLRFLRTGFPSQLSETLGRE